MRKVLPWGKVDDTIRACLVAKAETRRPETATTPVWFVDYPLGEPAFTTPVDGIGETKWLRRGLPKAPAKMRDVARVALGPRVRSEEEADFTATFEGRRYRLRSLGGPLKEPYVPAVVALESDGRTQILVHDIWDFRVRWAGDVDEDGRLDILIESMMTSYALRFDLFLSGKSDGRLVRLAAMDEDEGD